MNESPAPIAIASEPMPAEEYRSLSPLAIIALVLGVASALTLANPLLAIVPIGAIALAVAALRSIATSGPHLSGKALAVTGLCLATLFLGWGMAAQIHHQTIIRQRAREFADDWLKVVASGDLQRAHQLHLAREFRLDPQAEMPTIYKNIQSAETNFTAFFQSPALQRIVAAGPAAKVRFVEIVHQSHQSLADEVVLKYEVDGPQDTVPFWITVRRTFDNVYRNADWEIFLVTDEPPSV